MRVLILLCLGCLGFVGAASLRSDRGLSRGKGLSGILAGADAGTGRASSGAYGDEGTGAVLLPDEKSYMAAFAPILAKPEVAQKIKVRDSS